MSHPLGHPDSGLWEEEGAAVPRSPGSVLAYWRHSVAIYWGAGLTQTSSGGISRGRKGQSAQGRVEPGLVIGLTACQRWCHPHFTDEKTET